MFNRKKQITFTDQEANWLQIMIKDYKDKIIDKCKVTEDYIELRCYEETLNVLGTATLKVQDLRKEDRED